MTGDRLKLTEMQKNILRTISGYIKSDVVTKGMLARGRRTPELAQEPGNEVLAAALEMLDAGYFVEPDRWDVRLARFVNDKAPAELTEVGERERGYLERDDWR